MSVSSRFLNSTSRNIARFGRSVVYTRNTDSAYDPDVGVVITEKNFTTKAFKTEVTYSEANSPNLIGKEVSAFLISGKDISFKPATGDEISYTVGVDTITLRVQMVKESWAAESVALWRIICVAM